MAIFNFKEMKKRFLNESRSFLNEPILKKCKVNYNKKFKEIHDKKYLEFKKYLVDEYISELKKDILNKNIMIKIDKAKNRILEVHEIFPILEKNDYKIMFKEIDNNDKKERQFLYSWESSELSEILFLDDILELLLNEYLGNYISFIGKSVKGGSEMKIVKKIIKIGYSYGKIYDSIVVESDEGEVFFIDIFKQIEIISEKQYKLDPYGEEDWDEVL
jgi:hypothetical protein